jgi:NifB/MoaA-like Fe-S oxidoreductase
MKKLMMLGSAISHVSVVPVGLTKHREGLIPLVPFDREIALKTIHQVEGFARRSFKKHGKRVFYCSDELYMMAGLRLPGHRFYEGYAGLENGVGMMRLFIAQFITHARKLNSKEQIDIKPFSIASGILAAGYMISLLNLLKKCYYNIPDVRGTVYPIKNVFFGKSVSVSGLITGNDIAEQLKGCYLGSRLLIPQNMLRAGEEVFLDDMTVDELSSELNVPIRIVELNGSDFLDAILF